MLYERKQNKELYSMKHRNDSEYLNYNYENSLLDKSLSPYMYRNDTMNNYLKRLQVLISSIFDHTSIIQNMKNYILDKNDYRQRG